MIKVAIIGAGFMGGVHANAYSQMDSGKVKVMAICDKNQEAGEKFAQTYGCRYFNDFDAMINEIEIDLVDICLPTFLHEEYVIRAAQNKKNIFCEKPVTLDTAKLERMMAEVEKNDVMMMVGQVLRFWPEYVKAKELIEKKDLGEINYVFAARLSEHPKWSEWYCRPENSGGGVLDLHLHDIDFLCWLFGEVKSVYATGKQNKIGSWNFVSTILEFVNGVSATIQGVMEMTDGYPFTMDLKIAGTKKTYEYVMKAGNNLEEIGKSKRDAYLYENGIAHKLQIEEKDAYQLELEHFIDCLIQEKNSEIISMAEVRNVLYTIEAIKKSLETGCKVKVE
ncbi:gfo/Idh/MocA family oxidoreductase [Clostridiales bacterium COT073_COT-073]|nr:gfo/Idh/MocA family oxidoreductase [Clostridiales bacterium COT073_COT-073]